MEGSGRRSFEISKAWIQAVILVVLVGFFILGLLAYRTYVDHPPVPKRAVDPKGRVVYTGSDTTRGQQVFLHNGLMEYGSRSATARTSVRTTPPTTCAAPPTW